MQQMRSVKPRVMTPQSSVNFPKTHLKTASNSEKQYKKRVMRAVFALLTRRDWLGPAWRVAGKVLGRDQPADFAVVCDDLFGDLTAVERVCHLNSFCRNQ